MSRAVFRILPIIAALAIATPPASAQWSGDPLNNLPVADRSGEQVQPKLVATGDGGFYTSWFDNSGGGYDVYLQRLDAAGYEQWPHNGVLVADRDFSSTQDYGLDVDSAGNGLLAFRYNDAGQVAQVVAQKIAPDGSALWAPPGVVVSADADGVNSPRIAATGDGNIAVAWSASDGSIMVQKLDAKGAPLWGPLGVAIVPPSGFFFPAGLHGDADGNVIVSWSAQLSMFNRQMWVQKLAAVNGGSLWGNDPVKVFDGSDGALQMGYFPEFIADGAGGAVFVWYTVQSTGNVRVQHIHADGSAAFAQNGMLASTDNTRGRFEPGGAFDASTGDIYALWRETDAATQSQIGVYAQRIDSGGVRQWGDSGKVFVPMGATNQSQLRALPLAGGVIAAWVSGDSPNPMPIHVARIDADGNYAFPTQTVDIKTAASDTSRLAAAISSTGFAAYAWTDANEAGDGDIKMQNIRLDGSLGNPEPEESIFADGFDGTD